MNFRWLWILALLAAYAFAATPTPIVGVVVDSESELPITDVEVTYRSGKKLGTTNSDGRFEFTVDSRNAALVFKKPGYDSVFVELQDFADVLDIVVKDRGVGIPDIDQARKPMFTTGGSERSGMGFTIMESFMTTLEISSSAGKGTTVHMRRKIGRRQ